LIVLKVQASGRAAALRVCDSLCFFVAISSSPPRFAFSGNVYGLAMLKRDFSGECLLSRGELDRWCLQRIGMREVHLEICCLYGILCAVRKNEFTATIQAQRAGAMSA
jgi:hypothetical protein